MTRAKSRTRTATLRPVCTTLQQCEGDISSRGRGNPDGGFHELSQGGTRHPVSVGVVQRSGIALCRRHRHRANQRSEEHTSELQSLMRISYAVFCLKKKIIISSPFLFLFFIFLFLPFLFFLLFFTHFFFLFIFSFSFY